MHKVKVTLIPYPSHYIYSPAQSAVNIPEVNSEASKGSSEASILSTAT